MNLRCVWEYGCPVELKPNGVMNEKSLRAERVFLEAYRELFVEGEVPDEVGVSCCAQFAVTRERVVRRSKGDYERMRRWLVGTEIDDEVSGRVFEYSWHSTYRIFSSTPFLSATFFVWVELIVLRRNSDIWETTSSLS